MTHADVLDKVRESVICDDSTIAENAINQYAEQECIGFAEFIKDNSYTKSDKGWYQYHTVVKDLPEGYSMMTQVYDFLTIKDVYQLYLKSKNNSQ